MVQNTNNGQKTNWLTGILATLGIGGQPAPFASNDLPEDLSAVYEKLYLDGVITKQEAVKRAPALGRKFAGQDIQSQKEREQTA